MAHVYRVVAVLPDRAAMTALRTKKSFAARSLAVSTDARIPKPQKSALRCALTAFFFDSSPSQCAHIRHRINSGQDDQWDLRHDWQNRHREYDTGTATTYTYIVSRHPAIGLEPWFLHCLPKVQRESRLYDRATQSTPLFERSLVDKPVE